MGDLSRYERMAERAKARRLQRDELTRAELEAIAEPARPGESDVFLDEPHRGHRTHIGWIHGFGVICSCGDVVGDLSGPGPEPGFVMPDHCEVCDHHRARRSDAQAAS